MPTEIWSRQPPEGVHAVFRHKELHESEEHEEEPVFLPLKIVGPSSSLEQEELGEGEEEDPVFLALKTSGESSQQNLSSPQLSPRVVPSVGAISAEATQTRTALASAHAASGATDAEPDRAVCTDPDKPVFQVV